MFEDRKDQVSLDCKKQKCRTEEKAQQLGALIALADRRVLFPAPTAIWNSRFRGSSAIVWSQRAPAHMQCTETDASILMKINKTRKKTQKRKEMK